MTDKELIKQEIEKQIDYAEDDTRYTEPYREGLIAAYQTIKAFIDNSLPEEPASKDLDFLAISLEETIGTSPHSREVIKEHLQKAAEWQKKKDQETIELAEDHVMLAGMNKMKEEMMENAVRTELSSGMKEKLNISGNYKAYIIVIKEDNQ